jgi:hypothetical protein
MPRMRRVMPFLQRRQATWYLRFRLPVRLQELGGRSELRLSLGTRELPVARLRAERVIPNVYWLKQLARYMSALALGPEHVRRALDLAFAQIASYSGPGSPGSADRHSPLTHFKANSAVPFRTPAG